MEAALRYVVEQITAHQTKEEQRWMDERNTACICIFILLFLWEDLWAVLEVERGEVLGGEQRPVVLVRRRQHRREQGAGARPGNHIEVVGDPSVRAVQLLELGLEVRNDGRRDKAADAAAIDAQDRDELPCRRRRLRHGGAVGRASANAPHVSET
jgi:hypothetical protein